jgi:hypothetical protein
MAVPIIAPIGGPSTRVSLSFALHSLPDLDIMSKTDAKVIVFMVVGNGAEVKLGSTEKAKDNLNPRFATPILVDYQFELVQKLRFVIGDVDDHKTDMIGTFTCTVGDIVGARGQQLTANLKMAQLHYRQSSITIRAEEIRGANATLYFQWAGSKLDSAFSSPFFQVTSFSSSSRINSHH